MLLEPPDLAGALLDFYDEPGLLRLAAQLGVETSSWWSQRVLANTIPQVCIRHRGHPLHLLEQMAADLPERRREVSALRRKWELSTRFHGRVTCTHDAPLPDEDLTRWAKGPRVGLLIDDSNRVCRDISWAVYAQPALPEYWLHVRCIQEAVRALGALSEHSLYSTPTAILRDRRLPLKPDDPPTDPDGVGSAQEHESLDELLVQFERGGRRLPETTSVVCMSGFRPRSGHASRFVWYPKDFEFVLSELRRIKLI